MPRRVRTEDPDTVGGLTPRQVALVCGGPLRYAGAVVLELHEEERVSCDEQGRVTLGPHAVSSALEGSSPYRGGASETLEEARALVLAQLERNRPLNLSAVARALRTCIAAERSSLRAAGHLVLLGNPRTFTAAVIFTACLALLMIVRAATGDSDAIAAFLLPLGAAGVTYLLRPGWHLSDAAREAISEVRDELRFHGDAPLSSPRRWILAVYGTDPQRFRALRGALPRWRREHVDVRRRGS